MYSCNLLLTPHEYIMTTRVDKFKSRWDLHLNEKFCSHVLTVRAMHDDTELLKRSEENEKRRKVLKSVYPDGYRR